MAELPPSLARTPELDRWLRIEREAMVSFWTGKVELGQGILTALTLIVAEELGLDPGQVRVQTTVTGRAPNELITAGSMSVEHSGAALRQASAWARRLLLAEAAPLLGTEAGQLDIVDGVIGAPGGNQTISIFELHGGRPFDFTIEAPTAERDPEPSRRVGHRVTRVDLEPKIRGAPVFVHDLDLPGLCHARVVRPPSASQRLIGIERESLAADGDLVALVEDGSFLAVVAGAEHAAVRLAERAEQLARWTAPEASDEVVDLSEYLMSHETAAFPLRDGVPLPTEVPEPVWPTGARRLRADYSRPFVMHGSLAPSAAAARFDGDGALTVWSHSQGIEILRVCLAQALALEAERITVIYVAGAGSYGHNGADDVALDAALTARAIPGRPVLVQWTRRQEHQWEPYGPAAHVRLEGALDPHGRIVGWSHDVWGFTHMGRPLPGDQGLNMIAAAHLSEPLPRTPPRAALRPEVGIHRNAWPIYRVTEPRVVKRFVADSPLRTSSLRGLGAHANVFAIESFMDELAGAAERDPIAFRLDHLDDPRAAAVLERVVDSAGGLACAGIHRGRGVGVARYKNQACYAAVLVEVEVEPDTARIVPCAVWIAADAGRTIDPDGLVNQLEGGAIQSLSWTLKEAVGFDCYGVTSTDWESYPILRFSEVPEVTTVLIDRPRERPLGAGEATQGPTAGALGNAVYAATGLRVRSLPITAEALRRAAAGDTGSVT